MSEDMVSWLPGASWNSPTLSSAPDGIADGSIVIVVIGWLPPLPGAVVCCPEDAGTPVGWRDTTCE